MAGHEQGCRGLGELEAGEARCVRTREPTRSEGHLDVGEGTAVGEGGGPGDEGATVLERVESDARGLRPGANLLAPVLLRGLRGSHDEDDLAEVSLESRRQITPVFILNEPGLLPRFGLTVVHIRCGP